LREAWNSLGRGSGWHAPTVKHEDLQACRFGS
jgi:hypothetical protein